MINFSQKDGNVNPTVLLAGATGYIGSVLADRLFEKDFDLICPIRNKINSRLCPEMNGVNYEYVNICDESAVEIICKKI